MFVVFATVLVLGAVLLWALHAEAVEPAPGPAAPAWDGPPTPEQIAHAWFPLAPLGYDRRAVEEHLRRVAEAVGSPVGPPLPPPPGEQAPDAPVGSTAAEPPGAEPDGGAAP